MTTNAELIKIFERLMSIQDLTSFEDEKALQCLAHLIDLSATLNREDGHDKAFTWCAELEKRSLKGADILLLDYFRANAWANQQQVRHRNPAEAWSWNQPEALHQILALRSVVRHQPEFDKWDRTRQAQVLTNLANQLNSLGRFVEALPLWTNAIQRFPNFAMAMGNRGLGLSEYARELYDRGHQGTFLLFAHADLRAALSNGAYEQGYDNDAAKAAFAARKKKIEELINISDVERSMRPEGYSLGKSGEEQSYRRWALDECLFLNPLNDLGAHTIAARDVFHLPDFTTGLDEPPTLIGLFNQMKQEYVSARWMLYEGINMNSPHFSDRDVTLHNTLDYPSYSVGVEKVKAAYRVAYALFDKIAFFLNDYMTLNVNPRNVYFRRLWYKNQDAANGSVRDELANLRNWPWRGLFWLAKDLFDPSLKDSAEPDAQQLYVIRNFLEHSYLKVHEMIVRPTGEPDLWRDRLAYSVQRADFYRKTLRVLRLSRAALIYLSLGMHSEEQHRAKGRQAQNLMSMPLPVWRDEWKF